MQCFEDASEWHSPGLLLPTKKVARLIAAEKDSDAGWTKEVRRCDQCRCNALASSIQTVEMFVTRLTLHIDEDFEVWSTSFAVPICV